MIERSTEDAEWNVAGRAVQRAVRARPRRETPVPRWPASEDVDENSYEPLIDVPAGLIVGDTDEDPPEEPPARRTDDPHDHFVPPEPPRGPRLDWISRAAWLGLLGGPVLLILAALFDFGTGPDHPARGGRLHRRLPHPGDPDEATGSHRTTRLTTAPSSDPSRALECRSSDNPTS